MDRPGGYLENQVPLDPKILTPVSAALRQNFGHRPDPGSRPGPASSAFSASASSALDGGGSGVNLGSVRCAVWGLRYAHLAREVHVVQIWGTLFGIPRASAELGPPVVPFCIFF